MDQFVSTNGIRLHYLDHPGEGPPLVLMPGLTANAHSFDGLINSGLSPSLRVLALDMRGRGLNDKPALAGTPQPGHGNGRRGGRWILHQGSGKSHDYAFRRRSREDGRGNQKIRRQITVNKDSGPQYLGCPYTVTDVYHLFMSGKKRRRRAVWQDGVLFSIITSSLL